METVVIAVPGSEEHAQRLATRLDANIAATDIRRFPDGEFYCRVMSDLQHKQVALVSTLHQPADKFLQVAFLAGTARDLGAKRVGLVAPYLSFMRQDSRFHPGEGITSHYFAKLMSATVDWLVTVDPHLHRHHSLAEIYRIPTAIAASALPVANWVRRHVAAPMIVGPDAESAQWVNVVADLLDAPRVVLEKIRRGDRDVSVSQPHVAWGERTPVILDDIISTGRTMLRAVEQVVAQTSIAPVCVTIHPVFADAIDHELVAAGASQVVSCNTINHPTNQICIADVLAATTRAMLLAS